MRPDNVGCVQLEQELKKVEAVIDTVVDSHHLGFNHAIENYSKILTLFKECKDQVSDNLQLGTFQM